MKLTREEYAMFNLTSRIDILDTDGVLLVKKAINTNYEIKLFLLYDFYVEVFYNKRSCAALKAEPLWCDHLVNLFYLLI
jgi:hypothetical protein